MDTYTEEMHKILHGKYTDILTELLLGNDMGEGEKKKNWEILQGTDLPGNSKGSPAVLES